MTIVVLIVVDSFLSCNNLDLVIVKTQELVMDDVLVYRNNFLSGLQRTTKGNYEIDLVVKGFSPNFFLVTFVEPHHDVVTLVRNFLVFQERI